jgi:carbon storage regulator
MLVLTRRKGDQIRIGDGVTLKVLRLSPGSVRLGIDAPREIPVVRAELEETRASSSQTCDNRGPRDRVPGRGRADGGHASGQDSQVERRSGGARSGDPECKLPHVSVSKSPSWPR